MSTINATTFSSVITSGLDNYHEIEYGAEDSVDESFAGFTGLISTTGPNPQTPGNLFEQEGTVFNGDSTGVTWESDSAQNFNQLRVRVEVTDGVGFDGFAVWNNGSGFGTSLEVGEDLTVKNFGIDCIRAGIAEALEDGNSNLTDHIYLLDGSGNRITTGGGWADATAPQSFSADDTRMGYDATVSFTNTSGGSQTVDGVEVVYDGSDNLIIDDDSFNVTLNDGDTLELTTCEVELTLP